MVHKQAEFTGQDQREASEEAVVTGFRNPDQGVK